jgi:hypothetical protein
MAVNKLSRGKVLAVSLGLPGYAMNSLVIPLQATTSTVPVSTGQTVPANSIIHDVFVDLFTVASAATTPLLSAGITSSTIGFMSGTNLATAGIKMLSLASGSTNRGTLLRETSLGGSLLPIDYSTSSSCEITYSTNTPCTRLEGNLIVSFLKLRDE